MFRLPMPTVITAIAWLVASGTLAGTVLVVTAMARIRRILPETGSGLRLPPGNAAPARASKPGRAAVVVAARNESDTIEPALRSLLEQTDGDVLIVVVDDRSTDGTTEILRQIAAEYPALIHERIDELRVEPMLAADILYKLLNICSTERSTPWIRRRR